MLGAEECRQRAVATDPRRPPAHECLADVWMREERRLDTDGIDALPFGTHLRVHGTEPPHPAVCRAAAEIAGMAAVHEDLTRHADRSGFAEAVDDRQRAG